MIGDDTTVLLQRWYKGDREALAHLIDENLGWLRAQVRKSLNARWRRKFDTMDIVQQASLRVLEHGPRFAPENRRQFRAYMRQVLTNMIRDIAARLDGPARDVGREESLPSHLSRIPDLADSLASPQAAAQKSELQQWIQLGLQTLAPEDRVVVEMRFFEKLSFDEIGARLDLQPATVRQRLTRRALPKLALALKGFEDASRELSRTFGA